MKKLKQMSDLIEGKYILLIDKEEKGKYLVCYIMNKRKNFIGIIVNDRTYQDEISKDTFKYWDIYEILKDKNPEYFL